MPNSPFPPLFGKGADIGRITEKAVSHLQQPIPESTPAAQVPQVPQVPTAQKLASPKVSNKTSLKQKALSSLGDMALFVDKRKNIIIIVIIILILIAVIIVAQRQEQQRKKLKMMRRKLKRLMA